MVATKLPVFSADRLFQVKADRMGSLMTWVILPVTALRTSRVPSPVHGGIETENRGLPPGRRPRPGRLRAMKSYGRHGGDDQDRQSGNDRRLLAAPAAQPEAGPQALWAIGPIGGSSAAARSTSSRAQVPAPVSQVSADQRAGGVGLRGIVPPDPAPGHEDLGQGGLRQVLGYLPVAAEQEGGSPQARRRCAANSTNSSSANVTSGSPSAPVGPVSQGRYT